MNCLPVHRRTSPSSGQAATVSYLRSRLIACHSGAALAGYLSLKLSQAIGNGAFALCCCYTSASGESAMNFTLECEQEDDGRWIAEVPELPGVLSYGDSAADAISKAEILALRVIADRLENGDSKPVSISLSLPISA